MLIPAVLAAVAWRGMPRRALLVAATSSVVPLAAWTLWRAHAAAFGPRAPQSDQMGHLSWIPHGDVGGTARFLARVATINGRAYAAMAPGIMLGHASPRTVACCVVLAALALAVASP